MEGEWIGWSNQRNSDLTSVRQSFTDGCNTIVAGCTTYGATPAGNSPAQIVSAIAAIFNNRYNVGRDSYSAVDLTDKVLYERVTSGQFRCRATEDLSAYKWIIVTITNQASYSGDVSGASNCVIAHQHFWFSKGTITDDNQGVHNHQVALKNITGAFSFWLFGTGTGNSSVCAVGLK